MNWSKTKKERLVRILEAAKTAAIDASDNTPEKEVYIHYNKIIKNLMLKNDDMQKLRNFDGHVKYLIREFIRSGIGLQAYKSRSSRYVIGSINQINEVIKKVPELESTKTERKPRATKVAKKKSEMLSAFAKVNNDTILLADCNMSTFKIMYKEKIFDTNCTSPIELLSKYQTIINFSLILD